VQRGIVDIANGLQHGRAARRHPRVDQDQAGVGFEEHRIHDGQPDQPGPGRHRDDSQLLLRSVHRALVSREHVLRHLARELAAEAAAALQCENQRRILQQDELPAPATRRGSASSWGPSSDW
jgi:hypothetical protein